MKRTHTDQTWSQREVSDGTQSGREGCSWRWTTFRKTIQGSNKWKQRVWHLMKSDRHLTVKLTADPFNRSHKTVHKSLTEHFGMRKVCQLASASWQCTITKHCLWGRFWHPRTMQWFHSPLISQMTSISSQGLSTTYEYITLLQMTVSRQSYPMQWRTSQNNNSAMLPGMEGPPPAMRCFWRGWHWNVKM